MRLQRIYSSKLYVTSTRKDRIHAAIQDPINAELVQQLSDYLDDEGQMELKQAVKEEEAKEAGVVPADNSGASGSDDSFAPAPSGGGSHASFTGDVFKDFGDEDLEGGEEVSEDISVEEIPEEPAAEPEAEVSVEEATKVEGQPITAACQLWNTFDDVVSDCETIKGTLNSREDTTGVNRLQVKDSELWIYYKDDTNLNDKMVEVIEALNAMGYTYLTFNRLARSNNAMVFDISLVQGSIKSEKEIGGKVNDQDK